VSGPNPDEPRLAFEKLFRDTRTDLLAYILRRSPTAEDAADVLAETYLVAWRKLDAIPKGDGARLWLFGVARNPLLKGAAGLGARRSLTERLAAEVRAGQAPRPVDDERSAALGAALASLSERDREIILLTAWEDLSPKQIAVVLDKPVNVVRVRLHRARSSSRVIPHG
jgi:RNA polymerase sigma-70 factor (ECF subfamily)